MALAFGGGVRPELGRTDYTPFLQGSVAGAQMQARGGESIGAALANLGQDFAAGIEKYQQNKKITAEMLGNVEGVISVYPEVVANAPASIAPLLEKLVTNGTVNQKEAMMLHGYVAGQEKALESKAKQNLVAAQAAEAAARAQQIQGLAAAQEEVRRQKEIFGNAIAMGVPADGGEIEYEGVANRYFELGGTDVNLFNQLMQIEHPDKFEGKAGAVTLDDGSTALGVYTSKGQFQVLKVLGKDGSPRDRELNRLDKFRIRLAEIDEAVLLGLMSNEEAEKARNAGLAKEFDLPKEESGGVIQALLGEGQGGSPSGLSGDGNLRLDPKTGVYQYIPNGATQPNVAEPIRESQPLLADEGEFNFSDAFKSGLGQPSAAMPSVPNFDLSGQIQLNNAATPSALADFQRVYRMLANIPSSQSNQVPINPNAIRQFLPGPFRNF